MRRFFPLLWLSVALALSACGSPAATGNTAVTIAMGYIPDVQFAPFYVADAKGYYKEEGLNVTLLNQTIQDALPQVAQGRLTFANASGDEVLTARAQQIPIKMVFQTFQAFPVAVFAKRESGINTPDDLKGKTIGVPGRFGATYIGLKGLLYATNMQEQDVNIQEIGFTQAAAVREDKVPAAVGYANNEPFVLQQEGIPISVIRVADYISLVSNGIVASEDTISKNPELIKAFMRATAKGLQETIDDPEAAFQLALKYIPELQSERQPLELEKLKQAVALWRSDVTMKNGLGYSDPQQWETTYIFLRGSGILQTDVDVQQAFTNDLRK